MTTAIGLRLWRISYEMERQRRNHADLGHIWTEAAYCVGLGLMRLLPRAWR